MIRIRRGEERGYSNHGWLTTFHTFSFDDFHDPENMGFRQLRVINEDKLEPGLGYPTHSHRDVVILTYMLGGTIEHRDSLGNRFTVNPGDAQLMSSGSGLTHSENNTGTEPAHFLQLWIECAERGGNPGYALKSFPAERKRGRWCLLASLEGEDDSLAIQEDVQIYAAVLEEGKELEYCPKPNRHLWLQVVRGIVTCGDITLSPGSGAGINDEPTLRVVAGEQAEILLFDLN